MPVDLLHPDTGSIPVVVQRGRTPSNGNLRFESWAAMVSVGAGGGEDKVRVLAGQIYVVTRGSGLQ